MRNSNNSRSSRAYRLAFYLLITNAASVASAVGFPSWSQGRSDAGSDAFVDASVNPSQFAIAWQSPMPFGSAELGQFVDRGVATDGQRVYRTVVEGYPPGGNYHLLALDIHTGVEIWRQTIRGTTWDGVSPPSIMDGVVYTNRAGHSGISGGTDFDLPKMYGLDASTGAILFATRYSGQWATADRPTVIPGRVIAGGGYQGGIYSYNPTGGQQWYYPTSQEQMTSLVASGRVFLSDASYLSITTGQRSGALQHPNSTYLSPQAISENGLLYALTYVSGSQKISAFNPATLALVRNYDFGTFLNNLAVGGGVLAVSSNLSVNLYHEGTSQPYATWTPGYYVSRDMVLTRNYLFALSTGSYLGDTLYAVDLATGQSTWSMLVPENSGLALGDGYLFVSSSQGVTAIALVPEPSTLLLLITLVGPLAVFGRNRHD